MPLSIFADILSWFPQYQPDVILDVGAHQGDYSNAYAKRWPQAAVHAFEAHPVTAQMLRSECGLPNRVQVWPNALSDHNGIVKMTDNPGNSNNRVTPDGPKDIPCIRGDEWMKGMEIPHVSLLKVDAEAHDVAVLTGFGARLQDIDFVQVETMLNRHDPQGTFYAAVYDYMTSQGFYVFNHYGFTWEWRRGTRPIKVQLGEEIKESLGAPIARRVDTAYINPKLVGEIIV